MIRARAIFAFTVVTIAAIAIVIPLGGCGDKAYTGDAVDQALQKLSDAKKYHAEFDAQLTMDGDLEKVDPEFTAIAPIELGMLAKMDFDISDPEELNMRMYDFEFNGLSETLRKLSASSGDSEVEGAMVAGMMQQMLADIEYVFLGETYYFKVFGTWFEMSPDDLASLPDGAGAPDMDCMMQYFEGVYGNEEMMDYYRGIPPGVMDMDELSGGEIDGVKTRHFRGKLNSEQLMDELDSTLDESYKALKECGMEGEIEEMEGVLGEDMQSMKDLIASIFNNTDIELWIDDDLNIRQMKMDMDVDLAEIAGIFGDEHDVADVESITMNIVMTMKYSAFGEDVDIEAPEDALPFEELMDAFGGMDTSGIQTDSMTT